MSRWRATLCLQDPRQCPGWTDLVGKRMLPADVLAQWSQWSWADRQRGVPYGRRNLHRWISSAHRWLATEGLQRSLVVSVGTCNGEIKRRLLGASMGPVIVDQDQACYMGVAHPSAPAAEASAATAFLSLVDAQQQAPAAAIWWRSDSETALGLASLSQTARRDRAIAYRLRALAVRTRQKSVFHSYHVKGHSADPGNEMADVCAEMGYAGFSPGLELALAAALQVQASSCEEPCDLSHSQAWWQKVLEEPDPQSFDIGQDDMPSEDQLCHWNVAMANVMTLRPAEEMEDALCRRKVLADHFSHSRIGIIGIQEGRSRDSDTIACGGYQMVRTAAAHAPNQRDGFGVEIWIHDSLKIDQSQIFILAATPRVLLIRVNFDGRPFHLLSAHAPCNRQSEDDFAFSWWASLLTTLQIHKCDQIQTIGLFDANTRVGSVSTPYVGPAEQEEEDERGMCFHQLLATLGWTPPSTWLGGGTTWQSSATRWHRIDYVSIPVHLMAAVLHTSTDTSAAISIGGDATKEDHRPAVVSLSLRLGKPISVPPGTMRPTFFSRAALKLPEVQDALQKEWASTPPLPADWTADQMEAAISRRSRQLLAHLCPKDKPAPRADWMTHEVWLLIRSQALVRRSFFQMQRRRVTALLGIFFGSGEFFRRRRIFDTPSALKQSVFRGCSPRSARLS